MNGPWASCQIRNIAGCACAGSAWKFSPPLLVSDPGMYHGKCVTHVPWCMPGSLIISFIWGWWREKRSRHSWRMRNPQCYVSGKRPMGARFDESLQPAAVVMVIGYQPPPHDCLHWGYRKENGWVPRVEWTQLCSQTVNGNVLSIQGTTQEEKLILAVSISSVFMMWLPPTRPYRQR